MAGGVIGNLMFAVGFRTNTRGITQADSKIASLTKNVVGLGIAGITALAGIAAAGLKTANEFESVMSDVQSATGMAAAQMKRHEISLKICITRISGKIGRISGVQSLSLNRLRARRARNLKKQRITRYC